MKKIVNLHYILPSPASTAYALIKASSDHHPPIFIFGHHWQQFTCRHVIREGMTLQWAI
jgi:hypothetical protein